MSQSSGILGRGVLGRSILGGPDAYSGASTTYPTTHPPEWNPQRPLSAKTENAITQFLTLHGITSIFQGVLAGNPFYLGNIAAYQTLGQYTSSGTIVDSGVMVDQKITLSGTTIGYLRIPITTNRQPNPDASSSGYSNSYTYGVDLSVGLYNDSGGAIGTLVTNTMIPHEVLQAYNNSSFPEPQDIMLSAPVSNVNAQFPFTTLGSAVPVRWGCLGAGQWVIAAGQQYEAATATLAGTTTLTSVGTALVAYAQLGWELDGVNIPTSTTLAGGQQTSTWTISTAATGSGAELIRACGPTQIWAAPYNGSNLGAWIYLGVLPQNGWSNLTYCPTAQMLVAQAGVNFYCASFQQDGTLGAWQQMTASPSPTTYQSVVTCTTQAGQDYVYMVGGNSGYNTAAGSATYYTPITSSGATSAWVAAAAFPENIDVTGGIVRSQWQSLAGTVYLQGANQIYALSAAGGIVAGNPWERVSTPSYALAMTGGALGSLVLNQETIAISANDGISPWGFLVNETSPGNNAIAVIDNPDGSAALFTCNPSGTASYLQFAYPCNWITVPIGISGLTNTGMYHIVVSGANGNLSNGCSVVMSTRGAEPVVAKTSTDGGNTWVASAHYMPVLIFNEVSFGSQLMAFIEDTDARYATFWVDSPTNMLLQCTQWAPQTHSKGQLTKGSQLMVMDHQDEVSPGMVITGLGIPNNTVAIAVNGVDVTLSNPSTVTAKVPVLLGQSVVGSQLLEYTTTYVGATAQQFVTLSEITSLI